MNRTPFGPFIHRACQYVTSIPFPAIQIENVNDFLSQAYKGVTNWMTAFIDYTSNMLAEKNTLLISFSINIFLCEDMSHELSKLNLLMFW